MECIQLQRHNAAGGREAWRKVHGMLHSERSLSCGCFFSQRNENRGGDRVVSAGAERNYQTEEGKIQPQPSGSALQEYLLGIIGDAVGHAQASMPHI